MAAELVETIPLVKDASGVFRVAGSRVSLDLIVRAFERGATPEEIAQDFPTLQLPDVYQVIGYYLKHSAEFSSYLDQRAAEEQDLLRTHQNEWAPAGLRNRLLARRKNR
jgi:uncharacterized protein (DUF433 family)